MMEVAVPELEISSFIPGQENVATILMMKCSLCREWCPQSDIKQHTLDHFNVTTNIASPVICDHCGKEFKSDSELKNHANVHGGKHYHCSSCTRSYFSKDALRKHEHARHTIKNYQSCSLCDAKFSNSRLLQSHIKQEHGIENRFQCNKCKTYFVTENRFKCHDQTKCVTQKVKPRKEPKKKFKTGWKWTVNENGRYDCNICGRDFSQSYSVVIHQRSNCMRNQSHPA